MSPLNHPHFHKDRKQHRASCRPSRASVTLNLEALEERSLPNGANMISTPPPSFNQAAIALYSDGVNLGKGWVNQTFLHFDPSTAYSVPLADLNADIAFNSPYVGSSAPLFVLAGEIDGAQMQFVMQYLILQVEDF